ncbi:YhdP family protein [Aliamphritea spongicola]|nr:DUF3971 domain-containing protein [Aliamphritea spongicola]
MVNLNLPLDDPKAAPDVDVAVDLSAGQLKSDARQLTLSGVRGRLNYNQRKGLSSPSLKGQLFGEPFSASIRSRNTRQGTVTSTTLSSRVDLKKIQQWTGRRCSAVCRADRRIKRRWIFVQRPVALIC